jgi:iron complex outermembrane receptor protein
MRYDMAFVNSSKNKPTAETKETNWSAFVYDAGVSFRPVDMLKIYGKYSTIFRYPFTDELASWYGTSSDYFGADLKPETGFNAEGGIGLYYNKLQAVKATVQGNFFYMKMTDEIAYDSATYHNINFDEPTERIGTNIDLTIDVLSYLELNGAYSFVKATFAAGANKDKIIPLVPLHTIYGAIMGKLPFGLSFGPDFEYASEAYQGGDNANTNPLKVESFFLLGASARYVLNKDNKQYAVQLTLRNLLDEHYTKNIYWSRIYPENGRSFNISLSCKF